MVVCIFQGIKNFFLSCKICEGRLFTIVPYCPFKNVFRVSCDIFCFIPDIAHLGLLLFAVSQFC